MTVRVSFGKVLAIWSIKSSYTGIDLKMSIWYWYISRWDLVLQTGWSVDDWTSTSRVRTSAKINATSQITQNRNRAIAQMFCDPGRHFTLRHSWQQCARSRWASYIAKRISDQANPTFSALDCCLIVHAEAFDCVLNRGKLLKKRGTRSSWVLIWWWKQALNHCCWACRTKLPFLGGICLNKDIGKR